MLCEACNHWCHIKCANISATEYTALSKSDDPWLCCDCNSFKFTDSCFDISLPNVSNTDNSYHSLSPEGPDINIFTELRDARKKHRKNFLISYLNINSLRYKFDEIKEFFWTKLSTVL